MSKEIPISELKPGMYVTAVTKQSRSIKVKNEGYINDPTKIAALKKSGVSAVIIDPSKTKTNKEELGESNAEQADSPAEQIKYSTKPKVSLDSEMKNASVLYEEAKTLQSKLLSTIKDGNEINIAEVKNTTENIVQSIFRNQDALSCMARLRTKDQYLVEHSLNVSVLMSMFAKHLNLDRQTIDDLALGAFLHDMGKIKIPDEILHKKGKFTDSEYKLMQGHVQLGVDALKYTPGIPKLALEVVIQHHERLDGRGYPKQLDANNISQYGRMIAIVDSYDAMTAERVYKAGMHPIKAFKILTNDAPHAYDKELVEEFIQCLGVYPVGTLVKLTSGKLGLISQLNSGKPLQPFVRVFYNTRLNQNIAIEEIDLSNRRTQDEIDCCIKPEEFNINLLNFFKAAFMS